MIQNTNYYGILCNYCSREVKSIHRIDYNKYNSGMAQNSADEFKLFVKESNKLLNDEANKAGFVKLKKHTAKQKELWLAQGYTEEYIDEVLMSEHICPQCIKNQIKLQTERVKQLAEATKKPKRKSKPSKDIIDV